MTWKELKEFCNSISDTELSRPVIIFREEENLDEIRADHLHEDYYVDADILEYGCMPESDVKGLIIDNPDEYPDGMNHFEKIHSKGSPILWEKY